MIKERQKLLFFCKKALSTDCKENVKLKGFAVLRKSDIIIMI